MNEANAIIGNACKLSARYELSEECLSGSTVFSTSGREELVKAVTSRILRIIYSVPTKKQIFIKGDVLTPVFSWSKEAYASETLVRILLSEHETERLCISQRINIAHNVSFLIDTSKFKVRDDLKCDDMGSWKHNGSAKMFFNVKRNEDGGIKRIKHVKSMIPSEDVQMYTLKRIYYVNNCSNDVLKIISSLFGK